MGYYNPKELDLIERYSKDISCDLARLLRGIDEFDKPRVKLRVMNGRMTDIFDNYRRLHAIVLKCKEISNEDLIRYLKG